MDRQLPDFSSLRPKGGKRSTKRDRIVAVFLRQEGHLSADELVERVRREDAKIGRATVYRTLQWMVDAGIARKVDFGEGRSRFEPSYRHPRHFHLVCTNCHQSSEFLSSLRDRAYGRPIARLSEKQWKWLQDLIEETGT